MIKNICFTSFDLKLFSLFIDYTDYLYLLFIDYTYLPHSYCILYSETSTTQKSVTARKQYHTCHASRIQTTKLCKRGTEGGQVCDKSQNKTHPATAPVG